MLTIRRWWLPLLWPAIDRPAHGEVELVLLDVQGFPLIRRWHVVYPRGKRLSAAALAFKAWLFEHREQRG